MNKKRMLSLVLITVCFHTVFAQQNWVSQISGTTHTLRIIKKCNDLFVAAGDSGTLLSSPDCITWRTLSSGTVNPLNAVCWGNGRYVAVGDSGTIITSTDASVWTRVVSGTLKNLVAVTEGPLFLALAADDSGAILTSSNGTAWNRQLVPGAAYSKYITAIFQNNRYTLAANDYDYSTGPMSGSIKIYASTNGTLWTTSTLDMGSYSRLQAFIWGKNKFMAFSLNRMMTIPYCVIATSTDGTVWSTLVSCTVDHCYPIYRVVNCVAIVWGEPGYLAIGSGNGTITSLDGITWQISSNNIPQPGGIFSQVQSLIWDGEKYIGVGERGMICTSEPVSRIEFKGNKQIHSDGAQNVYVKNNTIYYSIATPSPVIVSLYDLQGKFLQKIVDCFQSAGFYKAAIPYSCIAGSYVISIKASTYCRVFKTTIH